MSEEILSVAELNRRARRLIEAGFPLLWVAGEISNLTRAPSGHLYFTLKDESAQVRCALFRARAQRIPFRVENGMQVEAQAQVTLYESRGEFQLNVETLRRAGLGRLYEQFLRLRDKLSAEGLFAASRKRPIPRFPRRLGLITSPNAAALRDVLAALARRAPHLELILYPSLVQGAEAPPQLIAALEAANQRGECDLLLCVRGGGSLEDLWAFNDEAFVRKLAASTLPVIVGVGHETDTTLADLAADLRAATPTAAAELASAGWFAARQEIAALAKTLRQAMADRLRDLAQRLDRASLRLIDPRQQLAERRHRLQIYAQRLRHAMHMRLGQHAATLTALRPFGGPAKVMLRARREQSERLHRRLGEAMRNRLGRERQRLLLAERGLAALSPQAVLARGYSLVRRASGAIVKSSREIDAGERVDILFGEGGASAQILATRPSLVITGADRI